MFDSIAVNYQNKYKNFSGKYGDPLFIGVIIIQGYLELPISKNQV